MQLLNDCSDGGCHSIGFEAQLPKGGDSRGEDQDRQEDL